MSRDLQEAREQSVSPKIAGSNKHTRLRQEIGTRSRVWMGREEGGRSYVDRWEGAIHEMRTSDLFWVYQFPRTT